MNTAGMGTNPSQPTEFNPTAASGNVAPNNDTPDNDAPNKASYRFFKEGTAAHDIEDTLAKKYFDPSSSKLKESERLMRFDELRSMLAPEHLTKLRLNVESDKETWRYTFSLDDDILYDSGSMSVGLGQDLALFQQHVLLQDVLVVMRSNNQSIAESDLKTLHSIARKAELQTQNEGLFLPKAFESMANVVRNPKNEASIALSQSGFQFRLAGEKVSDGKIPATPLSANGVTARVQMTMSAFRLALLPAQRIYTNFLSEYKSGELTRSADDNTDLSLFSGITDVPSRAKIKHIVDEHQNTFKVNLGVKEVPAFSVGVDRDVKVKNFTSLGKAIKFNKVKEEPAAPEIPVKPVPTEQELRLARMEMCKIFITPMQKDIYNGGVVGAMTESERLMLHTQLYKTQLGEFNLGELFNIPKPSDQEVLTAFGGVAQEF